MYKHYRLRDSKLAAWRSPSGDTKTTKNKPRVDYEPRSAHGRAVKNKPRVDYEPRSAHGRAVKNKRD